MPAHHREEIERLNDDNFYDFDHKDANQKLTLDEETGKSEHERNQELMDKSLEEQNRIIDAKLKEKRV